MKTKFISMESTNLMFQAPTYTRHEGSKGTKLTLGGKKNNTNVRRAITPTQKRATTNG